ncbi:MAG: hypothetical protein ABW178_09860 [Pseudoxanthomonas sp.]
MCAAPAVNAAEDAQPDIDLAALIECRKDVSDFLTVEPTVQDPLKSVAQGWQPLPQKNMFMREFKLARPVTVFGHSTDQIAFYADSVMAIVDLPDPRPLAKQLALETGIDTPEKAIFGKEVRSTDTFDEKTGATLIQSIILNVSNVESHPGKTLVGCTYNLDTEGPEPAPQPAPASVTTSAR